MKFFMKHSIYLKILLIICCQNIFSQEKYHFDNFIKSNVINYKTGYNGELIEILSHKDSTYKLQIQTSKDKKRAFLYNYGKKRIEVFNNHIDFKKMSSLKQLKEAFLIEGNLYVEKDSIKVIEEVEYENDTINKNKIVHCIKYSDTLKSKIYREYYYFFKSNNDLNSDESINLKNHFSNKFKIEFKEDENLFKILSLYNGKIINETEFLKYVNDDVIDLEFKLEDKPNNIFIQK